MAEFFDLWPKVAELPFATLRANEKQRVSETGRLPTFGVEHQARCSRSEWTPAASSALVRSDKPLLCLNFLDV